MTVIDDMDNQDQVILKPEMFWINATRRGHVTVNGETTLLDYIRKSNKEVKVADAIGMIKDLGPIKLQKGLEEWNQENSLILYRGKIYMYVPKDRQLVKSMLSLAYQNRNQGVSIPRQALNLLVSTDLTTL
jgi:hypothetical protein